SHGTQKTSAQYSRSALAFVNGVTPWVRVSSPVPNRDGAPVAQLDRVAASEAAGRWFESSRARQSIRVFPSGETARTRIRTKSPGAILDGAQRRARKGRGLGWAEHKIAWSDFGRCGA